VNFAKSFSLRGKKTVKMNLKSYTVTELYIYPIKSLAGIRVESAKAEEMGFENDRRWMLIDKNNLFIMHPTLPNECFRVVRNKETNLLYLR
jgi:uncharacterized protein YcbX